MARYGQFLLLCDSCIPDAPSLPYRGVHRAGPSMVESLDLSHPANKAVTWFFEEGGQSGVIHNLDKAMSLVHVLGGLDPPQAVEIVEVVVSNATPTHGRDFLGHDVALGVGNSLLSWGLDFSDKMGELDSGLSLDPLIHLVEVHFKSRLNRYGLFDDFDDAAHFLDCMEALQRMEPSLWDSRSLKAYAPIALYLVAAR